LVLREYSKKKFYITLMSSLLTKLLMLFAALLLSCSRESTPEPFEPKTELNGRDYNGGLFPVWITLKEPVKDTNSISWRYKSPIIAYRKQGMDTVKNLIKADTAYFYWDKPPAPFLHITKIDSINSDTVYYYRDTVYAIVDGVQSLPIVIEVKNILPRIKSISVGGVKQTNDSLLLPWETKPITIAAHPTGKTDISIQLEKPFNIHGFYPKVEMPPEIKTLSEKPSPDCPLCISYEWEPEKIITDSSIYIKIKDSGGYGERLYKVLLVVYNELGSVWISTENEMVKYTSTGVEVARISDFKYINDFAINSNDGRLFIADRYDNSVSIYDTYGKQLSKSTSFNRPTAIALDVVSYKAWIADSTGLQRFDFSKDILSSDDIIYDIGGIEGLATTKVRDSEDFVWFVSPQKDIVGFVKNSQDPEFVRPNTWSRPSRVSLDLFNNVAWIADSTRVTAVNDAGEIMARITDFNFSYYWPLSISAGAGGVWVSDVEKGMAYYFRGPFSGNELDLNKKPVSGMELNEFTSPVSVSTLTSDGSAWIVDREDGKIVRYDTLGNKIAYGAGIKLPRLGKTIQK
jgi:hypothetical protein